jgi:F-type H+-transporting ATPase subunit k
MGVLGLMFGGTYVATRGGSKKPANNTPPINASSPDEENFIKYDLAELTLASLTLT